MLNNENYAKLDFGTKVTTSSFETITVKIDPDLMIGDFADAYAKELYRRNPIRAKEVDLTKDELFSYFKAALRMRVMTLEGTNKFWRQAKELYIPCWIEAVMSMLGKVVDVERGIIIIPTFDQDFEMDDLLAISARLRVFLADGIVLHKDAFPRGVEGDIDVMTMAIIDGFVKGQKVTHPLASYIVAFLGMKIQQEEAFKILYRVRYDDVAFITQMLLQEGTLYA